MRRPDCPCKRDCEDRTITCKTDGTCKKGYAEWKVEMQKWSTMVYENRLRYDVTKVVDINRVVLGDKRGKNVNSQRKKK